MTQYRKPAALALAIGLASLASLSHAENVSSKLQINGFATAGGSWVTDDFDTRYYADAFIPGSGIDESGSYTDDNVLGIQLSYALDERFDLVGQLVSKGRNGYDTQADWAYIAYKANDQLRVRAGRFAAPFFLYSENRNVGQAYPWARLPVELYGAVPLDSLDGIDLLFRQPVGSWNFDAQLSAGGTRADYGALKNSANLNFTLSNDNFSVRAGYSASKLDLTLGKNPFGNPTEQLGYLMNSFGVDLDVQEGDASFADIGAVYDDGNWLVAAEFGERRIDRYLSDQEAGYLTVGHYVGKWLPYVMYSKINTIKSDECLADLNPALTNASTAAAQALMAFGPASPQFAAASAAAQAVGGAIFVSCAGNEQTSYSAGFRYDATKQVSVKLQLDHVRDFHNTPGYFSGVVLTDDDDTDVVTFNVNATF
jgi:hypothetical protein